MWLRGLWPQEAVICTLVSSFRLSQVLSVPARPESQDGLSLHLPMAPGICSLLSCILAPHILAGWEKLGLLLCV